MHKSSRLATVFSSLILMGALGCGNKEAQIVGHWKFKDMAMPASQGNNALAGLAKQMLNSMTVDFKADKTYAMSMMVPMEGTWALAGNTLTMTPTKIMGQSIDQLRNNPQVKASGKDPGRAMTAHLGEDGKTLIIDGQSAGGSVTLAKGA